MTRPAPPIIWSIAGTDSGGGAGLSADQRAADAFGVHLCPVVAAVTAQHSRSVLHIEPMSTTLIDAQLKALSDDMPPRVIKTGVLGGAAQVQLVARWVDRARPGPSRWSSTRCLRPAPAPRSLITRRFEPTGTNCCRAPPSSRRTGARRSG